MTRGCAFGAHLSQIVAVRTEHLDAVEPLVCNGHRKMEIRSRGGSKPINGAPTADPFQRIVQTKKENRHNLIRTCHVDFFCCRREGDAEGTEKVSAGVSRSARRCRSRLKIERIKR